MSSTTTTTTTTTTATASNCLCIMCDTIICNFIICQDCINCITKPNSPTYFPKYEPINEPINENYQPLLSLDSYWDNDFTELFEQFVNY